MLFIIILNSQFYVYFPHFHHLKIYKNLFQKNVKIQFHFKKIKKLKNNFKTFFQKIHQNQSHHQFNSNKTKLNEKK